MMVVVLVDGSSDDSGDGGAVGDESGGLEVIF